MPHFTDPLSLPLSLFPSFADLKSAFDTRKKDETRQTGIIIHFRPTPAAVVFLPLLLLLFRPWLSKGSVCALEFAAAFAPRFRPPLSPPPFLPL